MKRGFLNTKKAQKSLEQQLQKTNPCGKSPLSGNDLLELGKMLYGKVEGSEIPKDYKSNQVQIKPIYENPYTTNGDPRGLTSIMTTIPPGCSSPDGHTEWMTIPQTKRNVLAIPGHCAAVPKVPQVNHIVKDTPDKGKGVFATRDLKRGELIFAERPFLVLPRNIGRDVSISDKSAFQKYTKAQQQKIVLMESEKLLKIIVEQRMSGEDREAYMSLANSHTEDGSGPLQGIVRTNGYGIASREVSDGGVIDIFGYTGIARDGSRLNHSCMPNVTQDFSPVSFSFQFHAMKDITKGEELFYTYCARDQSAEARRKELAPFGFVCKCSACVNATPETNRLRIEYTKRIKIIQNLSDVWVKQPNLTEKVLEPVYQLKEALEREGFDTEGDYALLFMVLHKVYVRLGNWEKTTWAMDEMTKIKDAMRKGRPTIIGGGSSF